MKLTVQKVLDTTLTLTNIINRAPAMPIKGKYRLARMHAKLLPEFNLANAKRDELITAYGFHPMEQVPAPTETEPLGIEVRTSDKFAVPPDKLAEFAAAWKEIAEEEIEVDVQPIPLAQLDLGDDKNGSLEAHEIIVLGDLVTE